MHFNTLITPGINVQSSHHFSNLAFTRLKKTKQKKTPQMFYFFPTVFGSRPFPRVEWCSVNQFWCWCPVPSLVFPGQKKQTKKKNRSGQVLGFGKSPDAHASQLSPRLLSGKITVSSSPLENTAFGPAPGERGVSMRTYVRSFVHRRPS